MAAGIAGRLMDMGDVMDLLEARAAKPNARLRIGSGKIGLKFQSEVL
jgi:signal recognition particle GTPase